MTSVGSAAWLWAAIAYFVGAVPFGVLVGRMKGVDPRASGSGNIGATNVFRLLGVGPGLAVMLLDILKGFGPVWAAGRTPVAAWSGAAPQPATTSLGLSPHAPQILVAVGLCAILGHAFSPFLRFRGGKSVATACGVICALDARVGFLVIAAFVLTIAVTRYVSLGSTMGAVALPVGMYAFHHGTHRALPYVGFGLLTAGFVVYKHRANYKRLTQGAEPKFGFKGG